MPVRKLRTELARDGIFNTRDLGGMTTAEGTMVRTGRVYRADSLHRLNQAAPVFKESGINRVIDLRDETERERAGVLSLEGVEVIHHSLLDPTFGWTREGELESAQLLRTLYREILETFGERLSSAIREIAEVIDDQRDTPNAVAFHCSLGKDRTGLLAAMLLAIVGVESEQIVRDYTLSANATAVQLQWLWSFDFIGDEVADEDLTEGLWSARPETLRSTLAWVDERFGGFERYSIDHGLDPDVIDVLRHGLLVPAGDRTEARGPSERSDNAQDR